MVSPNQEYGRRGQKIEGFVIHKTEGSFKSGVDWCTNPKSQVSYHFIIDTDGEDVCLVMPENTAWHAGLIKNSKTPLTKYGTNPNFYTVGIAMSGFASEKPTMEQIKKCAELLRTLSIYYNVTLDKKTVVTHNSIRSDKLCPGLYVNIDALIYLAGLPTF